MERASLASRLRGKEAGEAKLEFFFRRGVRIGRQNHDTTTYIRESLDGSVHPALDLATQPEFSISRRSTLETIQASEDEIPDDADGRRRLKTLYKECFDARDNFLKVQKSCIAKCKRSRDPNRARVDDLEVPENATLQTIEETVQQVCMSRNPSILARNTPADSQLHLSPLEKIFKGFRDRASDFDRLTSLIPSDTFGSVLCGGISTIIQTGETYAALQDDIYKALQSVKDVMLCIPLAMEVFEGDEKLHQLTSSMCAAMFDVLSNILEWVTESRSRRVMKAVLRPKSLGQGLKKLTTTMELRVSQAKAWAECLGHKRLKDALSLLENMNSKFDDVANRLTRATSDQEERRQHETADFVEKFVRRLQNDQQAPVEALKRLADLLRSEQLQLNMSITAERATAVSAVYDLILDSLDERNGFGSSTKLLHRPKAIEGLSHQKPVVEQQTPWISAEEFLEEVGYEPWLLARDVSNVLRTPRLRFSASAEVHTLLNHVTVQAFVEVEKTSILYVCGADHSSHTPRSPISFATAKLLDGLLCIREKAPGVAVIGYFCGEHRNRGPYSTAEDLILTLILQLVSQVQGLDEHVLGECFELVHGRSPGSVEELCQAFEMLIMALPQDAVLFCVLDAISFFESQSQRRAQMRAFLELLLDLARPETDDGAKLKVLVTSPARCLDFHSLIAAEETLRLTHNLVSRAHLTERDARGLAKLSYLRSLEE